MPKKRKTTAAADSKAKTVPKKRKTTAPADSNSDSDVPSTSKGSRMTQWRRKRDQAKDRELLGQEGTLKWGEPGQACGVCGKKRHADTGHGYFRGVFYCKIEHGPGALDVNQWVTGQINPDQPYDVPRTTVWKNLKREEEGRESSRKPHKLRICESCGQPAQKTFGHAQYQTEHFCAQYNCKAPELWLAEKREENRSRNRD